MSTPGGKADEGVGCRPLAVAVVSLVGFAVVSVAIGLWLALGENPSPVAEAIGLAFYGAGAPISALFAVIAGELPLAPFTDIVIWLIAGTVAARVAERRSLPLWKPIATVIAAVAVWGIVVSTLIERV